MANSETKRFMRATAHWEDLRDNAEFSVPSDEGMTAVICSLNYAPKDEDDASQLVMEALEVKRQLEANGQDVAYYEKAIGKNLIDSLKDRHISSIVLIGHGSLCSFHISKGLPIPDFHGRDIRREYMGWWDVARHTDHLKTGMFVQRHCGAFSDTLNVPFGTFAMADHASVIAPYDEDFQPELAPDVYGVGHLRPYTNQPQLTLRQAQANLQPYERPEPAPTIQRIASILEVSRNALQRF